MNFAFYLCIRDPRNPFHAELFDEDDPAPPRSEDCPCDNCFYGRDKLALEIIRLEELLDAR